MQIQTTFSTFSVSARNSNFIVMLALKMVICYTSTSLSTSSKLPLFKASQASNLIFSYLTQCILLSIK
jgi:hypothetical protein